MESSEGDDAPVGVRDGSPLSVGRKREMVRTLDGALRYGADGLRTGPWPTFPGCAVSFVVAADGIEIRIEYAEGHLPGPVGVRSVDEPSSTVSRSDAPTGFVELSAAHGSLYEDLTDAAGRAVDPYAVTVPDSPVARTASGGTVTFVARLALLTGDASAERRTIDWR